MRKRGIVLWLIIAMVICVFALTACEFGNWSEGEPEELIEETQQSEDDPQHEHTFGEWETVKKATCTESGAKERTCTVCGEKQEDTIRALGHSTVYHSGQGATCLSIGWGAYYTCSRCSYSSYREISARGHSFVDGVCSVCGAVEPAPYTKIDGNGEKDEDGEFIFFGSYPQTEVKDEALKSSLIARAGELPTAEDKKAWTSYGYYISSSNSTDYMWYIDLGYGGEKYRGVYFTSYRPYYTTYSSSTDNTYQDDNGYSTSTVYWFRYDPIKWRILSEENGEALILCEMIIDSQEYYPSCDMSSFSHNGGTGYANNYALSAIRRWLNNTFYNTAFTDLQKALIQTTTVDNSARSTNPNNNATQWNSGNNTYACANTQDKVFLLSEQEVTNSAYGFGTYDSYGSTNVRCKKNTDYAKCQGVWTSTSSIYWGNGWWWLRSPYFDYSIYARGVYIDGYAGSIYDVYIAGGGVVPTLKIRLLAPLTDEYTITFVNYDGSTLQTLTHQSRGTTPIYTGATPMKAATKRHTYKFAGWTPAITEVTGDATYTATYTENYDYKDREEYIMIDANGNVDEKGEYLYFGSYPQTQVTDIIITTALEKAAGTLPTSKNRQAWTSYGDYFIDDSEWMYDIMWYIDVEYGGEKYRGLYFTNYRPSRRTGISSANCGWQYDNGYSTSTVYWFRYDPIKWRILSEEHGKALILCEMIIESREYHSLGVSGKMRSRKAVANYNDYYYAGNGSTVNGDVYDNNYQYSAIRVWLNKTFYNTAFTDLQKELILTTTVDNSERSTNPNNNATAFNNGNNTLACTNTQDKVFLLSEQEVTNSSYGFNSSYRYADAARQKKMTAFAQCQGAYIDTSSDYLGNGWWWLRSPSYSSSYYARGVTGDGNAKDGCHVEMTSCGVVPALKIRLS